MSGYGSLWITIASFFSGGLLAILPGLVKAVWEGKIEKKKRLADFYEKRRNDVGQQTFDTLKLLGIYCHQFHPSEVEAQRAFNEIIGPLEEAYDIPVVENSNSEISAEIFYMQFDALKGDVDVAIKVMKKAGMDDSLHYQQLEGYLKKVWERPEIEDISQVALELCNIYKFIGECKQRAFDELIEKALK